MKIDILSMQRVINYGSFFQAYALKKTLETMGHEVGFLDIYPGDQLSNHNHVKFFDNQTQFQWLLSKLDRQILKRIYHFFFSRRFRKDFKSKWQPILGLEKYPKYETTADAVIIGSDEVFNFAQRSSWGFSRQLFGDIPGSKLVFSYAASFGFSKYEDAEKAQILNDLKLSLQKLDAISVRDENSSKIIRKLIGIEPYSHVDPTFIYPILDGAPKLTVNYGFIILYSYDGRTNSPEEVNAIKSFAKSRKLKIVSIGTYHAWCDKNIITDPFTLLAYFNQAAYVVTDTFHGTIFSILTRKKFCTILRNSNSEKLSSLLKKFFLDGQELHNIAELEDILDKEIDYDRVERITADEKSKSIKYISSCLKTEAAD